MGEGTGYVSGKRLETRSSSAAPLLSSTALGAINVVVGVHVVVFFDDGDPVENLTLVCAETTPLRSRSVRFGRNDHCSTNIVHDEPRRV